MIEPGSIQVCGLCCVCIVLCVWYINSASNVIPYCLFKHYILFLCMSVGL